MRVKKGVKDPDFPDMPLGGWAGLVREVRPEEDAPVYLVEWNAYTLEHTHPVYRRRCEREGLELTSSWLGADDLEPDRGGPPEMEQPTDIRPRPLDANDLEDRIRSVLGLTSDEPLANVDDATLLVYHRHLAAHLALPVPVDHVSGVDFLARNPEPLTLVELPLPQGGEARTGLLAITLHGGERREVRLSDLDARVNGPARQLLADYAYWFTSRGAETEPIAPSRALAADEAAVAGRRTVINAVSRCGLYGACVGAAVGAVTATMDGVLFAMGVGALTMAVVGYVAGTRYGFFFGKAHRINSGPILGGILGVLGGSVLGVVAGTLTIAYVGTIFGSIVGALLGQLLRLAHRRLPGPIVVGLAGAGLGAIVQSWMEDAERTLVGLLYGTAAGAAAGLLLSAGFFGAMILVEMHRNETE